MKKELLFIVCAIFCVYTASSQFIELLGVGVNGKSNATLTLSDLQSIEKVDAHVTSKGLWSSRPIGLNDVEFDNSDTPSSTWARITGSEYLSPSNDPSVGVYSRSFDALTGPNINASMKNGMEEFVHSYYLFVHRNDPSYAYMSYADLVPVFMYKNGSSGAYEYSVPINTSNAPRTVVIKIPISELDDRDRNVVIDVFDKYRSYINERFFENTWNKENSLNIAEYTINDVPGEVDEIVVSIFSPVIGDPDVSFKGDSFFVG